jgi:hypothetical protein
MFMLWSQGASDSARLRAVLDSVFARPDYNWQQPPDPFGPLRRAWAWLGQWLQTLRSEAPSLYWIFMGVLMLLLLAILAHAAWVMYRTMRGGAAVETEQRARGVVVRDAAWYAGEAERLAAAGRFAEAMQADFLRLILDLDERRLVRFHPSRTPNEYAREPALSERARGELAALVRRLYAYAYARIPCGLNELDEWRTLASAERYARA